MNFKKLFGIFLLFIMLLLIYTLFGGIHHENVVTVNQTPFAVSNTSEITEDTNHLTIEECAPVDLGCIAAMLLLIGITSFGSVSNANEEQEE
jgi:hypothetical protein